MTLTEFLKRYTPITRSLKNLILDYQQNLPKEKFKDLLKFVANIIENTKENLEKIPDSRARAEIFHQWVDAEVERASHTPVSCKKGCATCCHYEVEITNEEALLLADLVQQGHKIDSKRLRAQAGKSRQDSTWKQGAFIENRCVFLGDDMSCSIYLSRPTTCRRMAVTTPAEHCADFSKTPTARELPQVDIMLSAMMSNKKTKYGNLAKMLSAELEQRAQNGEMQWP